MCPGLCPPVVCRVRTKDVTRSHLPDGWLNCLGFALFFSSLVLYAFLLCSTDNLSLHCRSTTCRSTRCSVDYNRLISLVETVTSCCSRCVLLKPQYIPPRSTFFGWWWSSASSSGSLVVSATSHSSSLRLLRCLCVIPCHGLRVLLRLTCQNPGSKFAGYNIISCFLHYDGGFSGRSEKV